MLSKTCLMRLGVNNLLGKSSSGSNLTSVANIKQFRLYSIAYFSSLHSFHNNNNNNNNNTIVSPNHINNMLLQKRLIHDTLTNDGSKVKYSPVDYMQLKCKDIDFKTQVLPVHGADSLIVNQYSLKDVARGSEYGPNVKKLMERVRHEILQHTLPRFQDGFRYRNPRMKQKLVADLRKKVLLQGVPFPLDRPQKRVIPVRTQKAKRHAGVVGEKWKKISLNMETMDKKVIEHRLTARFERKIKKYAGKNKHLLAQKFIKQSK